MAGKRTTKYLALQKRIRQPSNKAEDLIINYPDFKMLGKNSKSGLHTGYVNFIKESSKNVKQAARKNLYAKHAEKVAALITNPEILKTRHMELEKLWNSFISDYNETFDELETNLLRDLDSISGKITKKEFTRLSKEIKSSFHRSLNDSRRQEFFAFAMSGQSIDFNPHDWVSGIIDSDIKVSQKKDGTKIGIQLKKTGGEFKVGYTLGAFYGALRKSANTLPAGKIAATIKALGDITFYLNNLDWKAISSQNNDPAFKINLMKEYTATTAADYVMIEFSGLIEGTGYSILLDHSQLVTFVTFFPDLFKTEFKEKNNQIFLRLTKNPTADVFWKMPLLLKTSIHYYTEHRFYYSKGTTRGLGHSPGSHSVAESTRYRKMVDSMENFVGIHESLFGPLTYSGSIKY